LKINLKGHHFDTNEVMEAELEAVLNTLTEHDFQAAFRKWQKPWGLCTHIVGDCFEGIVYEHIIYIYIYVIRNRNSFIMAPTDHLQVKKFTLRVVVATRPKVSFDQMASPAPEIMD
jgi:hypothetical protein